MRKTHIFFLLALLLPLAFAFFFYPVLKYSWVCNERYTIKTILQKKPSIDSLKCAFLAEALGLTSQKINLYQFDLAKGEEALRKTFVIKDVCLKKIKPHTLFVDYSLREPLAYFADKSNTALDEEGMLFPFAPFYTPKHLPEIYFGDHFSSQVWGKKINEKKMRMAKDILSRFPPHSLRWMDLSHIDTASLGQKEIVVEYQSFLLRLSPKNYQKEINHFFSLLEKMNQDHILCPEKKNCVVDLRLPQVAFLNFQSG